MTTQEDMTEKLKSLGLPYHEIKCYGSQITVECLSRETAEKWAVNILCKFSKVRGILESTVQTKENKNTVLRPSIIKVWRVYAVVS